LPTVAPDTGVIARDNAAAAVARAGAATTGAGHACRCIPPTVPARHIGRKEGHVVGGCLAIVRRVDIEKLVATENQGRCQWDQ
jgi:hypothetical protein